MSHRTFGNVLVHGRAGLPVLLVMLLWAAAASPGQESTAAPAKPETRRLTTQELADWIDRRFDAAYAAAGLTPAASVDDATFLRRVSLDLMGRIPSVAHARDFLAEEGSFKRQDLVDRLLNDDGQPERFAQHSSEHLARVWRRMMVPRSAPGAAMAPQLEPWLSRQFAANIPYDQFARKLLLATPAMQDGARLPPGGEGAEDAQAALFGQAVGGTPENLASAYVRVFLGVRLNCAQCHDHPLADWKREDFWGVAALLAGGSTRQEAAAPPPTITPSDEPKVFTARLLWSEGPLAEIPAGTSPRELLADWMVSPQNPNFAATAVNRAWQHLCGRGLAGSVDDLDQVSPAERAILDELAELFVAHGYDLRWLTAGICKSRLYQQLSSSNQVADGEMFLSRPLKSLLPDQVFDSLEQALGLPIARTDNGPRFNGERAQFVARLDEAAADSPAEFRGGIPQALMLMNGKLTAEATSLEASRTLRAVIEAPFLTDEQKLETLYLATLTRLPRAQEQEFLLEHVRKQATQEEQRRAYAEIFWGLLNGPEFVLSR